MDANFTGAEIGLTPRYDIITFVISDEEAENFPACTSDGQPSPLGPAARLQKALPIYDMNVTVFPVDNQAPSLITGDSDFLFFYPVCLCVEQCLPISCR